MMSDSHPVHPALRSAEYAVQELAELEALLSFQPWVEDARKSLVLFNPRDEDSVEDLEHTVMDLLAAFTERLEELTEAHPDAVDRPRPKRETRVNYANPSRDPDLLAAFTERLEELTWWPTRGTRAASWGSTDHEGPGR